MVTDAQVRRLMSLIPKEKTRKSVSLNGPTGGSVWANSGCSSHYFIRNNAVVWAKGIDPSRHAEYARSEQSRLIASQQSCLDWRSWLKGVFRCLSLRSWRK